MTWIIKAGRWLDSALAIVGGEIKRSLSLAFTFNNFQQLSKLATRAPIFLYFSVYLLSAADQIYALPSVGDIGGGFLNIAKRLLLSSSSGIDDPGPEFLVRRAIIRPIRLGTSRLELVQRMIRVFGSWILSTLEALSLSESRRMLEN